MSIIEELSKDYLKPHKIVEVDALDVKDTRIYLKYEHDFYSNDILWNIKRKPAFYLFHDLYRKGVIREGVKLISASSGNFVLNLGVKALEYGYDLIAVTPPGIPKDNVDALRALGVDVIHITEEFDMCPRETTVFYTRSLAERYRYKLVNIDQYIGWQNALSHLFLTWREISDKFDKLDYILVALGSTGTYMGVSLGNKIEKLAKEVIGVQPPHKHHIPGVHHIVGECEWNPEIYSPSLGGRILTIDDVDAYRWMAILNMKGLHVGPSTSMLFAALEKLCKTRPGDYLIISPDSDKLYKKHLEKIYGAMYTDIVDRYPEEREYINRYIEQIKSMEEIDVPKYIKKYYKVDKEGELYEISKLDTVTVEKLIKK